MEMRLNKTNSDLDPLIKRLKEIRMPEYERLIAEAHLARAEAIADLLVRAAQGFKALARKVVLEPARRTLEWVGS